MTCFARNTVAAFAAIVLAVGTIVPLTNVPAQPVLIMATVLA